jgi:hypothetical protein
VCFLLPPGVVLGDQPPVVRHSSSACRRSSRGRCGRSCGVTVLPGAAPCECGSATMRGSVIVGDALLEVAAVETT